MLSRIGFALGFTALAVACSATTDQKEEATDESTSAFGLGSTRIAGSLDYGDTSALTKYRRSNARYVAYKFAGSEGDEIDVWVKSNDGDPVTWILDDDWRSVAKNDDASAWDTNSHVKVKLPANASATHYIVVRDYWLDDMNFRVELNGKKADPASGCNVDADCTKVEKSCCPIGNYIAIEKDNVASYQASLACPANQICPKIMIRDDHSMAECNVATHTCELALPKDIHCGGFIMNAHECPTGYKCQLTVGQPDVGGSCVQFCGGIAGFACSDPNEQCVDDPSDGCDPAAGGADCGGICTSK